MHQVAVSTFFNVHPTWGDDPIWLYLIFFNWGGSTTNYFSLQVMDIIYELPTAQTGPRSSLRVAHQKDDAEERWKVKGPALLKSKHLGLRLNSEVVVIVVACWLLVVGCWLFPYVEFSLLLQHLWSLYMEFPIVPKSSSSNSKKCVSGMVEGPTVFEFKTML